VHAPLDRLAVDGVHEPDRFSAVVAFDVEADARGAVGAEWRVKIDEVHRLVRETPHHVQVVAVVERSAHRQPPSSPPRPARFPRCRRGTQGNTRSPQAHVAVSVPTLPAERPIESADNAQQFPWKPPRMHWRTCWRLRNEAEDAYLGAVLYGGRRFACRQ
jgi:hypothetical protein